MGNAKEVVLETEEGFKLVTDYYQSVKSSNLAVLMLHQCNYNRSMYQGVGQELAQRGIHSLSLDFRGFGESTSEKVNSDYFETLSQEEQSEAWRDMTAFWPSDVQLAYDFLQEKTGKDSKIAVIGASCGGSQAITLSEQNLVEAVAFFSSGQNDKNIVRYTKRLSTKPTLIIAAEEDGGTYTSAVKLFKASSNQQSKFISYKGGDHGYPLLDKDAHLGTTIVNWFEIQLSN